MGPEVGHARRLFAGPPSPATAARNAAAETTRVGGNTIQAVARSAKTVAARHAVAPGIVPGPLGIAA